MEAKIFKCPNCDATLPVNENSNIGTCEYCGSSFVIKGRTIKNRVPETAEIGMDDIHSYFPFKSRTEWEKAKKYFFLIDGIVFVASAVSCSATSVGVFYGVGLITFLLLIAGYIYFKKTDPYVKKAQKAEQDAMRQEERKRRNDIKSGKIEYRDLTDDDLKLLTGAEKIRLKKMEQVRDLYEELDSCFVKGGKRYNSILKQIKELEDEL